MFTGLKDAVAEKAARAMINQRIAALGTVTKLEMNSRAKTVRLELDLRGETMPIIATINNYRLIEADNLTFIELLDVSASREWIDTLARQYLVGKRWEIPAILKTML